MPAHRILVSVLTACAIAGAASTARGDIPAPVPEIVPVETKAPLKVTIDDAAAAEATLVIPRRFVDAAAAAGAVPGPAPAKSNSLPAILATIAGGGALSLGVLVLGIYLFRRTQRSRTAVAGAIAAATLFVGAGAVFGDLLPFSQGNRPPREPDADLPKVTIVIAEEGDAIELTLPKAMVQAKQ